MPILFKYLKFNVPPKILGHCFAATTNVLEVYTEPSKDQLALHILEKLVKTFIDHYDQLNFYSLKDLVPTIS